MLREKSNEVGSIYELLFYKSNIIQIILNIDTGLIENISKKACIFFNESKEELLNYSINDISNVSEVSEDIYNNLIEGNTIKLFCAKNYYNGSMKWINCKIDKLTLMNGKYLHIYEYEESEVKEELVDSFFNEYKYMRILENFSTAICVSLTSDQQIIYFNKEFVDCFGYTIKDISTIEEFYIKAFPSKIYREKIFNELNKRLSNSSKNNSHTEPMEVVLCTKSGEKKYAKIFCSVCNDYNYLTFIDLTPQKDMEVKLMLANQFDNTIIDMSLDPIVAVDMNYKIVYLNSIALNLIELPKEQVVGNYFYNYIDNKNHSVDVFNEIIEKGSYENYEVKFIDKDGYHTSLLANSCRMNDIYGNPLGIVSILRDNTLNKNKIMELEASKQAAEEANNLKNDFISNISHELRTPINVIFSSLQLLEVYVAKCKENVNYNNFNNCIRHMKQNSHRLIRLTDNLINLTKLDAGFTDINLENCEVVYLLKDLLLSVSTYAKRKNINLIFNSSIQNKTMALDIDKFIVIVLNLLSNAIKFTPTGGEITVGVLNDDSSLKIIVKDNGIGIPPHRLKDIFGRFVQIDNIMRRRNEGSGIGLSLVKSYTELHGGTIDISSNVGVGTQVTITLPILEQNDSRPSSKVVDSIEKSFVDLLDIEFSDIYDVNI